MSKTLSITINKRDNYYISTLFYIDKFSYLQNKSIEPYMNAVSFPCGISEVISYKCKL